MSRNSVLRGSAIELTVIFLDAGNDYTDPTDISVSIFPPGKDPRTVGLPGDAWVYQATLADPGTGPEADPLKLVEKIDVGRYKYVFTVPDSADLGAAFDQWEGTIDSQDLDETFSFTIVGGGSVGITQLLENNKVFIELDKSVASLTGVTLGSDYTWYFTSLYNPLYSSYQRIRMDMGPVIADVPNDTINLAIFEASLEADALTFGSVSLSQYFVFARRQYVTCVAEMTLLHALLGTSMGNGGGRSKSLADLKISNTGNLASPGGLLDRVLSCRAKWESVLTSGGEIGPGTSQKPSMVVKGSLDPDHPAVGRTWEPISSWSGMEAMYPAANTKVKWIGNRRFRGTFARGTRWDTRFS